METFTHWITEYGYFGLFSILVLGIVGLPIPDETLLTFAGYLAFRHRLSLDYTILVAFVGSTCGITVSYLLGRSVGLWLLHRYGPKIGITDEKMKKVLDWFDRIGKWTLPVGYFIPGVRHLTAYVAGASKLQYPIFALFAYVGGFCWSLTFILLGYFLGRHWESIPGKVEHHALIAVGIIVGAWIIYKLVLFFKTPSEPPGTPGPSGTSATSGPG